MNNTFILLLYHGISSKKTYGIQNYSKKHIPLEDFDKQMKYLKENYNIYSLRELLILKKEKKILNNSIAITFDDGFENNFFNAYPILTKYNIPATFYISTGFIGTSKTFWVDKLEILLSEIDVPFLELTSINKSFIISSDTDRLNALIEIKKELKQNSNLINLTISELQKMNKGKSILNYDDYSMLSWDQVRIMEKSGLCDFGAHTVDHAILSQCSKEEKIFQIKSSINKLSYELEKSINLFSYPEGLANHYDEETITILKELGVNSSPTAIFGTNSYLTSNFHLFRNMVGFYAPFLSCLGK